MAGNTFGTLYKITTFGESHGKGIGVVIDGCPSGLKLDVDHIFSELQRRKPGQSKIVTQRHENEEFEILSGVFEGITTGTPLAIFIRNQDQRSKDYSHIAKKFRPSHADYTYTQKYGLRDYRGGGRSSARETAARVIAGAIAKQVLKTLNVKVNAFVSQVGTITLPEEITIDLNKTEDNIVRCPHPQTAEKMIQLISQIKKKGDTIGGKISCVVENCPVGIGAPVFDKLHAELGKAMLSINAVKGFEIGSGFSAVQMLGSEHNDAFESIDGKVSTKTNYSGGIQGGISNGMNINFNVAFKPVATIIPAQDSVDEAGNKTTVEGRGRHDPCVVPRAVPIVESMAALVILDHIMINKSTKLDDLKS
ncbi:MAG: chorismate synthase [Saprospiraceae bacterium]|nr:chorismate synthase [Saprospiraceae bacterium]